MSRLTSKLFVISGPSGAGKGTLVARVRAELPSLGLTVSATTREPREGEVDGTSYYFLTEDEFTRRVDADEFVEWANVHGHRYGTLRDVLGIRIDGRTLDATTVQQVRRRTAWLPQEFTLPYDTIQELIEAPFRLRINQTLKPSRETILEHFDRLGLEHELYDKRSIEISGGQRQRIMLMIAALLQKDIVLLDEPTSALDPDSIARVIDYIRSLHEATVLMVSHDARFIDSFDRKIYIGD